MGGAGAGGWILQTCSGEYCVGASSALRAAGGVGRVGNCGELDSWFGGSACGDWRRDLDDQFHSVDLVRARTRSADLAIFWRESGPHSAAISVCDFLRDAGGRALGIGRAFAADEETSGLRREQSLVTISSFERDRLEFHLIRSDQFIFTAFLLLSSVHLPVARASRVDSRRLTGKNPRRTRFRDAIHSRGRRSGMSPGI